ncbi:MAG TPA: DUF819 family protein [Candidatus Omnitrophota bacterium]|nr:DUF819 family protein [Candidatus Omnitrophota bacterium]
MIQNPFGIFCVLLLIEALILFFSESQKTQKFFRFPPALFWIYFIPMLVSGTGVIPRDHVIYAKITGTALPAGLILLLIVTDIKAILKLGRPALMMMFAGTAGIMVGAPAVIAILKPWLPADAWSGFGTLSASWIGGRANMVAVKEAIRTPDAIFFPMIVVDTVVAYSWMGMLILLEGIQKKYDAWNRSDRGLVEDLVRRTSCEKAAGKNFSFQYLPLILAIAFGGGWISNKLAGAVGGGSFAWTIIFASTLGILLSFTSFRKLELHGASRAGYLFLFLVLTSIGARASLSGILSAPILIAGGVMLVLIHGAFILIVSRVARIPLCLAATASQANIGGPASAPIVAAAYEPALAPVGLLLGILGNVMGTYLGLVTSQLCRWVS